MALADRSSDLKPTSDRRDRSRTKQMRFRLLVVARDFWPTHSDASRRLGEWCQRLSSERVFVEVLTEHSNSLWPARMSIDGVQVTRLSESNRFLRKSFDQLVQEWLEKHQANFDIIYFDEAADISKKGTTVQSLRGTPARVVRVDRFHIRDGRDGNPLTLSNHVLASCRSADAVLTNSTSVHQAIIAGGVASDQVLRIHDFEVDPVDRSIGARRDARQILREANLELDLAIGDRLVLCPFALHPEFMQSSVKKTANAMMRWLDSVGSVLENNHGSRLWILSDSHTMTERMCQELFERFRNRGWQYFVLMPGIFTDLDELLQAADAVLIPPNAIGHTWLLPKCVRSRIPVFATENQLTSLADIMRTDGHSYRARSDLVQGQSYSATDLDTLTSLVQRWLRDPESFEHLATAAHNAAIHATQPKADVLSSTQALLRLPLARHR